MSESTFASLWAEMERHAATSPFSANDDAGIRMRCMLVVVRLSEIDFPLDLVSRNKPGNLLDAAETIYDWVVGK